MMSEKPQRDFFLVLTIAGLSLCFWFIGWGVFTVVDDAKQIAAEIMTGDPTALSHRVGASLSLSAIGGCVLKGTLLCNRRYHILAFDPEEK